jgi:hypothetical protein
MRPRCYVVCMSNVAVPTNGRAAPVLAAEIGVEEDVRPASGWFARLLGFYLRHREATRPAREAKAKVGTIPERAKRAIDLACVQSAVSGGAVGVASTGATVITASTEGAMGLVAIPLGALAIGAEMALRTWIHIDLICTLADIFEFRFNAEDPEDIGRLCALAFRTHGHDDEDTDPGKKLVTELSHVESEEIGEKIGAKVLGESVMRSIVPVLGIAVSAVTNYRLTRRLGDTTRRYMRYQRALNDALAHAIAVCEDRLELLIEGMWFVFIADGKLSPEESACLVSFLDRLDEEARSRTLSRLVEDEFDWLERLGASLEPGMHAPFFHVLEVAAAVDKNVSLPERRLLRSAARRLGVPFDPKSTERLMKQLEETGRLSETNGSSSAS